MSGFLLVSLLAATSADYVRVPGGMMHRSCIKEVEFGIVVDAASMVLNPYLKYAAPKSSTGPM